MNNLIENFEVILTALLTLSFFVERIVQITKKVICRIIKKDIPSDAKIILSIAVSIVTCVISGFKVDYGFVTPPLVNEIITGVILSGGSGFIHTLLSFISSIKDVNEVEADAIYYSEFSEQSKPLPESPTPELYGEPVTNFDNGITGSIVTLNESSIDIHNGIIGGIKMSDMTEKQKEDMRKYWENN